MASAFLISRVLFIVLGRRLVTLSELRLSLQKTDAVISVTALRIKLGDEADTSTRKLEPLVDTEIDSVFKTKTTHEIDNLDWLATHSQKLISVFNKEQGAFIPGHTAVKDWLISCIELVERS